MCASLCGMMTATTFTFDDKCHWEKYAMILPISKKAYVLEKYVLHMIFSLLGVAAGTTVTVVADWFQGMRFKGPLWQVALFGFGISMAVGFLFLPCLLYTSLCNRGISTGRRSHCCTENSLRRNI